MAAPKNRSRVKALLDRASANFWLGRLGPALQDLTAAERVLAENPTEVHEYVRAARLLRAQWRFARGEPAESLTEIDRLLQDIGYPSVRIASRLASMLTLKARAELALGRTAAALATSESAVGVAEAMSLDPQSSASVGRAACREGARGRFGARSLRDAGCAELSLIRKGSAFLVLTSSDAAPR